jgi:ABC-type transport system involved in multi-copper enzyme maturation permease subunit
LPGEYQWGTWKNIVPRQARMKLIFAKFLVLATLILLALLLTSLVLAGGGWLQAVLFDIPFGPALADLDVAAFLQQSVLQVVMTFASTLIVASYAAMIAMYSRSIIASLLLSVGVGIVELTSSVLLLDCEPGAATAESGQHHRGDTVLQPGQRAQLGGRMAWRRTFGGFPGFTAVPPLWLSVLILLVWLGGLVGGTAVLFRRQDITS